MRLAVFAMLTAASNCEALAQDPKRGEHVFRQCRLCHVVDPKARDLVAPPLHNIVGRRAATVPGFDYSAIMKAAGRDGLMWTPEALFYFLDRPEEFIPGTYMAFSGLDEQERHDVIAYLEKITREFKAAEAARTRPAPTPAPAQRPPARPRTSTSAPIR
jgi:cytochrome c